MSQPDLQVGNRRITPCPRKPRAGRGYISSVGVLGALACIIGFVMQPEQLMRGYLIGYMLWLGLSLGCMALLMVQHLSGGLWGLSIRRILEAASKGIPLMLVLFVPLVLGRHYLYAWMKR